MNKISTVIIALLLLLAPLAAPAITMTSPNGGETLALGASFPVTWTATGVTQNVKLILLREDNSIFEVIARELAPGGSPYNWTVGRTETGDAPAGRYKIRVSTMDGGQKDVSDAAFTISDGSSPSPTISVSSPNGGESWELGSSHPVTWSSTGLAGTVNVSLLQGGTVLGSIGSASAAAGSLAWTVGDYSGGTATARGGYRVRVTHSSGAPGDDSNADFAIGTAGDDEGPLPAGIHDFMISDPVLEERGGGRKGFRVTVTDLGSDYSGRLILQQYCMNMGLGNAIKQGEVLDLRRGVPVTVDLFNMLPTYFGDDCGTNFRFDVNPDRAVAESGYGNNVIQKKFFWKGGHDGRFFSLRLGKNYTTACDHCTVVIRPGDVDIVDASRVRIRLEISLRNCGPEEIRGHDLDVVETWDGGRSSTNAYRKTGIVIAGGNFGLYFIDVVLTRHASNSLEFNFDCGEGGDLDANNTFHCHLNYIGF